MSAPPRSAPAPQQAPHTTAAPPHAPTAEASSSSPRVAFANSTAQDAINPVPASTGAPSTAPPATANSTATAGTHNHTTEEEEPLSFNDKLNAGDRYWKFKIALKTILIITGLIGIGCIGWTISHGTGLGYEFGFDFWSLWPTLITFSVSILWCLVCILVFILRKRPVHPGVRVSIDLLLWLGFIVTALFATAALTELLSWGDNGDLGYGYSSRGEYELADNGTWVWEQDNSYVSSPRSCNGSSSSSYYYEYGYQFSNCSEQDAFINKLWQEKPQRANIELTAVVCQFIGLLLHFALFVWACVDTHHYNRSKVSSDAEKLAANIVQTMINNGTVVPPPGQAYMRPAMGQGAYYQLPPQQQQQQAYPLATMYPQQRMPGQNGQMAQGQYRAADAPGTAGPSNEKSQGPRYA